MKIGLYFGSFNPIHIGHLIIANHMVEHSNLDQVWFVVTPHNPFKEKKSLLADNHRLAMVNIAVEDYTKLKSSDVEFKLKQPNYTIDTLIHLVEKFPAYDFSLILGEDNLKSFHKWKNHEEILANHHLYVYPRIAEGKTVKRFEKHPKIHKIKAPIVQISSTMIRKGVKAKKNVQPLMQKDVWKYLDEMNFYKK